MKNYTRVTLIIATLSVLGASSASAGGLLADIFIRPISPHAADEADKIHRKLGKPLDKAAATAVGVAVGGGVAGAGK